MFRIAKNLVKSFEQSVQDTFSQDSNQVDAFLQSIPPNLLTPQFMQVDPQSGEFVPRTFTSDVSSSLSGLRVLWVDEYQLQLQSFFDYIVGINDDALPLINNQHGYTYPDYTKITEIFNNSCNSTIKLNIWSAKGGTFRDEYISIQAKNETQLDDVSLNDHSVNNSNTSNIKRFQSLGFKTQWTPLMAATHTYHIIQLNIPNGPAQQGGLIPDEDYIIGCQDGLLSTGGSTLLPDIVRSRANNDLLLYVYNKVSDCVRPITVHIGPDGRLGCNTGYGLLHRIPTVKTTDVIHNSPTVIPGVAPQVIQSPEPLSESAFVPNALNSQGTSAPPPIARKKKAPANKEAVVMSDYFNEGKDESLRRTGNTPDASAITPPPMSKPAQ